MEWRNWGGNQVAHPQAVEHPRDVEEVAALVKRAATQGQRVKAVGSGHSFTAVAATDGVHLDLDQLSGVVSADAATGLVTVQAGIPLHRLNAELWSRGLAMTNLGDIDRQTIAGATSTSTHGTGIKLGGLATQIRGLEIVLADGSVVTCSAEERPDLFAVARVGLGALGVVTAVTLQCEPSFTLRADEGPMPLTQVMEEIDDLVDGNEHFEFYWFPHTDTVSTKRNNRLREGEAAQPLGRFKGWLDDEFFANTAFGVTCRVAKRWPALIPRLNRMAAKLLSARSFSAPSYEVFVSPRRVRFVEMEYSLPRAAFRDGFQAIRDVIEREDLRVSFPIEARWVAPDDIPLSTAYGEERCYLAIHMFRGEPYERYFRAVESELRQLGGRPHWGKMHWRPAEDLRPVYPRFDEFVTTRDAVDPDRVFGNAYLETVLGR
ncbi:MAG TPA: D-arabinono-1,4-lactone oxidase [Mycobacteriales bacterium]|nr:D-arabinono-1,4-lactone oxidase [Mycobacteriales bacterium]